MRAANLQAACADPGIFVRGGGGVQVSLTKKALTTFFFFVLFFRRQLILQQSNGQFQRNLSFFKVPEGVQHFPGEVQLFPGGRGGGSNCLFPIETHITCDFHGGSGPPVPPSASALGLEAVVEAENMSEVHARIQRGETGGPDPA